MDWRHQAACLHEDPELFFPVGDARPLLAQVEEAKAVCRQCPVIDACLSWALETRQDTGVWGGRSESERRKLRRRATRTRRVA
ncbi:WhiB family transcriptional regulator [Georgenia sp. H159]|uniref:WhiB family transcriptional regulator n=1 Tax=Georgenia sp. H159 TaxID=3076115 RepID=UPI002D77822C|nr:WhiB family transcriptional regulator [Georgenia sp. H159]